MDINQLRQPFHTNQQANTPVTINELPTDILHSIAQAATPEALFQLHSVSKKMRATVENLQPQDLESINKRSNTLALAFNHQDRIIFQDLGSEYDQAKRSINGLVLEDLSKKTANIRYAVAENQNANRQTLLQLFNDDDIYVRDRATRTLKKRQQA